MKRAIYTYRLPWGDTFRFSANLIEASAPICIVDDEGNESSTQYQTADARHGDWQAFRLALQSCGRDFYADPHDTRDDDDILDEIIDETDEDAVIDENA